MKFHNHWPYLIALLVSLVAGVIPLHAQFPANGEPNQIGGKMREPVEQLATFAGGCFWCLQPAFDNTPGVKKTTVGYTGGQTKDPSYEEVSTGTTGHYEAIQVTFDPTKVSYRALVDEFFHNIDPTDPAGQFADRGPQYRTAIFCHSEEQRQIAEQAKADLANSGKFKKPIVTPLLAANEFYPAESYHQTYYKKNSEHYNRYKVGSGRADFVEKNWGKH